MTTEPNDSGLLRQAGEAAGIPVPADMLPADHQVILNQARFHYLD